MRPPYFDEITMTWHQPLDTPQDIAADVMHSFTADREGKIRTRLIKLGWMPPEVAAELKAAFRVNMLQRARPGEDIATEIDRVLSQFNPVP